jgi:hypothetical protein
MGTKVALSSVQRFIAVNTREIEELESIPRANKVEATKAARLIVGSYQQKANDPNVYMSQLVASLHNAPLADVVRIGTHEGILATCKFLPSIAEVREWLELQDEWRVVGIERRKLEIEQLSYRQKFLVDDPQGLRNEAVYGWLATRPALTSEPVPGALRTKEEKLAHRNRALDRILANPETRPITPEWGKDARCALRNLESWESTGDDDDKPATDEQAEDQRASTEPE